MVQLDVIGVSDSDPQGAEGSGPITSKHLDISGEGNTGAFDILVPVNEGIRLSAMCDNDGDGSITDKGEDLLSAPSRLGVVSKDISDVSLVLL